MAMVKRVACFLTCGYTEAGAMQAFLKKINGEYEYKQYLPNRTIKKKGDPKNISSSISGLTGLKLLEKVYKIIENHRSEIAECTAILMEDDLDDRFSGFTEAQIVAYNKNVKERICQILGHEIPVFLMYASPEIESWFLADWENGFSYLYCNSGCVVDLNMNSRKFFVTHLKQFIEKNVLKEYCDNIELFGTFDGKYIKLSERLIEAVQTEAKEYIKALPGTNTEYVDQIVNSRCLYYSKKLHGDIMLRNIEPQNVAKDCTVYFRAVYFELQNYSEHKK
jgi:hypothetical protein